MGRQRDLDEVEVLMGQVEHLMADLRIDAMVASELSLQQLKVLMLAVHRSPVTAHDVADTLRVSAATVSGLVGRLVDRGLLVQEPDPRDGRARRLRATEAGEDALDEVASFHLQQSRDLLERMTDEEIAALRVSMGGLARAIRETVADQRVAGGD